MALTAAVATAALLTPLAPVAVAADPVPPEMEATAPGVEPANQQLVTELRSRIDELMAANTELVEQNSSLGAENETLSVENDQLQQQVDSIARERDRLADDLTRFEELYEPIEADRKLLLDLRKPIEDLTRSEAEQHIRRMRDLALSSDPSGLGQLADRLGEAAPAFLEWREQEFTSTEQASQSFIESGANAFTTTLEEFENRVLLTVASRLDGLLNVLDRAR